MFIELFIKTLVIQTYVLYVKTLFRFEFKLEVFAYTIFIFDSEFL